MKNDNSKEKKGYLIVPLAGLGARFSIEGYSLPKQLLPLCGVTTLEYSLSSLVVPNDFEIIVILRSGYMNTHDLKPIFKNKYELLVQT